MMKLLKISATEAANNIAIATEDIVNCYKKGILLAKTSLFEELSFVEGYISIRARYINELEIQYWTDDEILPELPADKVRFLGEKDIMLLKKEF